MAANPPEELGCAQRDFALGNEPWRLTASSWN